MTNGGTPFQKELLLITSGRGDLPPSLVRVSPYPPYNTTVILDNFFGRQFNSLNDIEIHPTTVRTTRGLDQDTMMRLDVNDNAGSVIYI